MTELNPYKITANKLGLHPDKVRYIVDHYFRSIKSYIRDPKYAVALTPLGRFYIRGGYVRKYIINVIIPKIRKNKETNFKAYMFWVNKLMTYKNYRKLAFTRKLSKKKYVGF